MRRRERPVFGLGRGTGGVAALTGVGVGVGGEIVTERFSRMLDFGVPVSCTDRDPPSPMTVDDRLGRPTKSGATSMA